MQHHLLKCWPEYFEEVERGDKTFELRKNDRDFKLGDHVVLREFKPAAGEYTGRELDLTITYVLDPTAMQLAKVAVVHEEWCIFSFKVLAEIEGAPV